MFRSLVFLLLIEGYQENSLALYQRVEEWSSDQGECVEGPVQTLERRACQHIGKSIRQRTWGLVGKETCALRRVSSMPWLCHNESTHMASNSVQGHCCVLDLSVLHIARSTRRTQRENYVPGISHFALVSFTFHDAVLLNCAVHQVMGTIISNFLKFSKCFLKFRYNYFSAVF